VGGLGGVTYRITTANELAQSYFNQGLRLTYAFNHSEAQRAFRQAQKLDPDCAMCFWGEALVLGPNINLPMQEDAVAPAFAAAEKARMLAPKATPREQALIAAVSTRYAKDAKADRVPLDAAYVLAMEKVAAQFPDDNEIAVLYAESVMDLSRGITGSPAATRQTNKAAPSCRRSNACWRATRTIRARCTITSTRWRRRTGPSAPSPMRTGCGGPFPAPATSCTCRATSTTGSGAILTRWPTTRRRSGGRKISGVDQCSHGRVSPRVLPAQRPFRAGVCPDGGRRTHRHRGGREAARSHPDEVARGIALVQPVKAAPYFAHALFSPSATVLALPDPGDAIPYVKAMWHYARGIAYAAQASLPPPRPRRMRSRPSRAGISRCSNPRAFRHRTCWRWRALSSKPASRSVRATRLQRSSGSSGRLRCRTGCPTWSRPYCITRCGSRSQSR